MAFQYHPPRRRNDAFTFIEALVTMVIIAALAWLAIGYMRETTRNAERTRQVSCLRQITLACRLYASAHDGVFPAGTEPGSATTNANTVLQDLITTGEIELEALFWNPRATHVCATNPPNENGILEPGENAFDYIAGLKDNSRGDLPLLVEAQTSDNQWLHVDGHPQGHDVVVGYVDASADVLNADHKTGAVYVEIATGGEVQLLSKTDEAGTIPGNLPANAEVKRAAPPRGGRE